MTTHYQKIQALGNKMVSNLESMGVSANFNDGGMTLADKILEIQHFDNGLKLYADKNIGQIGDKINLYALVLKDNIAQSGKTILFKGLDYSVYGVTGNNGIANVTYTCSGVGDKNIQAIYQSSDSILVSSSSITVVEEDKAVEILSNISNWVASTSGVNNAEAYTSNDGYAGIKLTATGRTVLNQYFTDKTAYTLEFDMLLNKDNRQGISFNQEPSTETDGIWFGTDVGNTLWNDETTLSKNYFTTGTHHFKLVRDGSTAKWIIDDEEVYTYTGMERNCIGFVIWGYSGWLAAYNFRFTNPYKL